MLAYSDVMRVHSNEYRKKVVEETRTRWKILDRLVGFRTQLGSAREQSAF